MKITQKALAFVLSVVMLVGCLSSTAFAIDEVYTPSIIIPGIFQGETKYYENGIPTSLEAPFFMESTIGIVGVALTDALIPISKLLVNQEDKDNKAAQAVSDILGEALMKKTLRQER